MSAASTPSGMASSTATMVAMIATCSDSANRSLISSQIGAPVHIELPKSSRTTPQIQVTNCRHLSGPATTTRPRHHNPAPPKQPGPVPPRRTPPDTHPWVRLGG